MERCEIVYRMSADASVDGISAREIADVIYSFADVVDTALKESGEDGKLQVNVRPFKQGSFVTEFVLTYSQPVVSFFTSPEGMTLTGILTTLGFMNINPASVTKVIRKVRGRIDKCRDNGDGTYSYGDRGDCIDVDERTHKLIQSPDIAKSLKNISTSPMINIGRSINVTIQSKAEFEMANPEAGSSFDESDIPDMDTYEHIAVEGIPEEREETSYTMRSIPITPVSGSYGGGERGYSFKCFDDTWKGVRIHDLEFRTKLENGEIRLMSRDSLIVDMEILQTTTKSGKESVTRTITKVVKYTPYKAAEQLSIADAARK